MYRQSIKLASRTAIWMFGAILLGASLAVVIGPVQAEYSATGNFGASPPATGAGLVE